MTVNNIEVTVNTCTARSVTTKDQSGGIYNKYIAQVLGGQGFMVMPSRPQTQSVYCHKSLAPVL